MPKKNLNQLSPLKVASLKEPGRYHDGLGLFLDIRRKGGAKSWLFRYQIGGKRRELGLGPVHTVSLAEARARAREARQVILDGRDPIDARAADQAARRVQALKTVTFEQAVEKFLATAKVGSFKNDKHRKQWRSTLASVFPVIGNLPLNSIDTATVLAALSPIFERTWETGYRTQGRMKRLFDWATPLGYFDSEKNPAEWDRLKDNLPERPDVEHHPSLHYADLPAFMAKLRERDSVSALAVQFIILTGTRTGDVLGAKWSDIDLKEAVWNIPVTKTGKPHRVPLSRQAIAILRAVPRTGEHVFINGGGKPLSNMAMAEMVKGFKLPSTTPGKLATVHGFRSSFRTWADEQTAFDFHTKETALAHVTHQSKVTKAYNRGDALDKRRRLMSDWSRYCEGKGSAVGGNVVAIRSA